MDEAQAPPDRTAEGVVRELLPSQLVRVEHPDFAEEGQQRVGGRGHRTRPESGEVRVLCGGRRRLAPWVERECALAWSCLPGFLIQSRSCTLQ